MKHARLVSRSYIVENKENAEFLYTYEGYDYFLVNNMIVKTIADSRPIFGVKY